MPPSPAEERAKLWERFEQLSGVHYSFGPSNDELRALSRLRDEIRQEAARECAEICESRSNSMNSVIEGNEARKCGRAIRSKFALRAAADAHEEGDPRP